MRLVNIIQNHAKRMNGIVENILQLSSQEQSRPEMVELSRFLNTLAEEFGTTQSAKSVEFKLNIEEGRTHVVFVISQ